MDVFERAQRYDEITVGPEDILLTGQAAVVTGGGGGIGQGIALTLAKFGADVAIIDNEVPRAEHTAELIEKMGRRAIAFPIDVTDGEALRSAIDQTADQFGRLDILVNNAGGVSSRLFVDQSERSWRRHIDLNLVSMLTATSAAVPHMIKGGRGGSIVNVSSIEGSRAAPMFAVYAACKAGMNNFALTMALELGEHGIRINCLAPDHTITPGVRGNRSGPVDPSKWRASSPEQTAAVNDIIPVGREGIVEELGSAAVFLCSKLASYITGATIPVDGGTHAAQGWLRTPDHRGWTLTRSAEIMTMGGQ